MAYIVLWIVVPESDNLKEDKKLKKMYLNPQGRVIGGVANGVAAYFGADIALIRVLFVNLLNSLLSFFFFFSAKIGRLFIVSSIADFLYDA